MKVILTQSFSNLGNIGEIVDVKNGYGRNFLFPKKIAIPYSEINYKSFESKKKHIEEANLKQMDLAKKIRDILEEKDLIIIESASDDGQLYGSVKSNIIAKELNRLIGENLVERSQVKLEKPIKETGIHVVSLSIHPEIDISITAYVSRTNSEAENLIRKARSIKASDGSLVGEL